MNYRFSEEEFLRIAENYFDKAIVNIRNEVNLYNKASKNKLTPNIKNKRDALTMLDITIASNKCKDAILHRKAAVAELEPTLWKMSNKPQSFKWVLTALLMNEIFQRHFVCTSYICRQTKWNFQMLKEVVFIGSGLFSFETWNDDNVDVVASLFACQLNGKNMKESIDELINSGVSEDFKETLNTFKAAKCAENMAILKAYRKKVNSYKNDLIEYEETVKEFSKVIGFLCALKVPVFSSNLGNDEKLEIFRLYEKKITGDIIHLVNAEVGEEVNKIIESKLEKWIKSLRADRFTKDIISDVIKKIATIESHIYRTTNITIPVLERRIASIENGGAGQIIINDCIDWSTVSKNKFISACEKMIAAA